MRYYSFYESPLGDLLLIATHDGLTGVHFLGGRHVPRIDSAWRRDGQAMVLTDARQQLREYFARKRRRFDLPLAPEGTSFQQSVWQALTTVPFGETCTYREIAQKIGCSTASRAVGAANGRNPISVIVPCHRIIGSDGRLTGYAGGLQTKHALLELERYNRRDSRRPA